MLEWSPQIRGLNYRHRSVMNERGGRASSAQRFSDIRKMALAPAHRDDHLQQSADIGSRLIASALHLLPFSPSKRTLPPHLHGLQNSVLSAADDCIRTITDILSTNPIIQRAMAVSEELRHLSVQVRRGSSLRSSTFSNHTFAAILPGDSVAGLVVANGISNFLNIYNTLLVVRLVLTWFPNTPPAIVSPLSTLCDPYLNIFRGVIPPLGGTLDLSPILAFLVLNAFTSTASALPAELPVDKPPRPGSSVSHGGSLNPSTSQKLWLRRISSKDLRKKDGI